MQVFLPNTDGEVNNDNEEYRYMISFVTEDGIGEHTFENYGYLEFDDVEDVLGFILSNEYFIMDWTWDKRIYSSKERVIIDCFTTEDGFEYYKVYLEGKMDRTPSNIMDDGIFMEGSSIDDYSDEWIIVEDYR